MNDLDDWNVYKGEPSPELDRAWDDILKYRNQAIPSTYLPKHLSSIPILTTNGTSTNNLLVNLDVFHNLHCLNTIREYIFRSYYSDSSHNLEQINHCVDSIRQALQCHADISIGTYSWKENHSIPWPNFRIVHECRNWDMVLEWAKKNDAGVLKGRLVHPSFGELYLNWVLK
ncbi:tat pathway signal sequence protein [Rutstroemia sp. NJR-2017a BVV2]|nr:tat pathway signal sequence protein [Rutstroemia sp. NJR-2017a BVV2]